MTQVKNDVFLFGINDLTSSLWKQLRVSVFVLRVIKLKLWVRIPNERIENYFKNRLLKAVFHGLQKKGPNTTREIHLPCLLWVRFVQMCSFSDLFCALKKNKNHSLKRQLGVKLDEFGILRCYGRYANADIDIETKNPKLLSCKQQFSKLVIMEIQCTLVHAGVSHTLSHLRHEFWIPKGQAAIRRAVCRV